MNSENRFRRTTRPGRALLLVLTLALALGGACGPEGGADLALQIHYTRPDDPGALRADPPTPGVAPDDITDYRVCVSGDGMKKPKCQNFNRADNPSGAKVNGLKPGSNRTVTFQGYDSNAEFEVRWCGNVSGVDIKSEKTTQVSMFISVCGDFTSVRENMSIPRAMHTATLMEDGRVLIVGGFTNVGLAQDCPGGRCLTLTATSTIDIYDPTTGRFAPSSGLELQFPRGLHTATALPNNRVLVAGGAHRALWRISFADGPAPVIEVDTSADNGLAGSSAELIDLNSMTVQEVAMTGGSARADHRAIAFSTGDVMLVGGISPATNTPTNSIARYQASSNDFVELANASQAPRQGMSVAGFSSGTYLIWGGNHTNSSSPGSFAEILYEEQDGEPYVLVPAFVVSGDSALGLPSFYSASASLGDNKVLSSGGMIVDQAYDTSLVDRPRILNAFRVMDMTAGSETFINTTGKTMGFPRAFHSSDRLSATGEVLVAGGLTHYNAANQEFDLTDRVEFFSLDTMEFTGKQINSAPVALSEPRAGHAVTPLPDGTLLFTGGLTSGGAGLSPTNTAEIYNPSSRSLRVE